MLYLLIGALLFLVCGYLLGRVGIRRLESRVEGLLTCVTEYKKDLESSSVTREELETELGEYKALAEARAEEIRKIVYQKKSSEVRTGRIAEQMAPFLAGFPYDPKRASFLGNPIDFVVFNEEGIHFVEVKSGKSQLNSAQRRIRDQVVSGKVTFEIYRIKGD